MIFAMFLNSLSKHLFVLVIVGFCFVSCSSGTNTKEEVNLSDSYREKIMNQKIMLDDALKQLSQEKQQVEMLKKQVDVSEQQLQAEKSRKVIPIRKANDLSGEYQRMKGEVENWKAVLQQREYQYEKVKRELDNLISQLGNFNIEVVQNKLGEIEKINNLNKIATSAGVSQVRYDSLMQLLNYERSNNIETVDKLKRSVAAYSREVKKWKTKFSKNGIYLPEKYTQLVITMQPDTTKRADLGVKLKIKRSAEKLRETSMELSLMCKLPNGNLVNLYKEPMVFQKNVAELTLENIKNVKVENTGWHEFIAYIDNKEAFYEDLFLSR